MQKEEHNLIVLKELVGNKPTELTPLQKKLEPHVDVVIIFWSIVWCLTLVSVLVKFCYEYHSSRK